MTASPDVVGLGYCVWDTLIMVPQVPEWDRAEPEFAQEIVQSGGGPVATALVTLARLGAAAGFIGVVGDDVAGQCIQREFAQEHVDLHRVQVQPGAESRQTTVLVQTGTGKRSFLAYPGSVGDIRLTAADRAYITSARFLHLDGLYMTGATQAARWMRGAGGQVVYDASRPKEGLQDLMPYISVLISNASFPGAYTGQQDLRAAGDELLRQGPSLVVVTRSESGCVCLTARETITVPGFDVPIVDTTGAGDAFHGAFIYGLLRGWSTERTAIFANAVGAINCTALSGRAALPSLAQTLGFLAAHGHSWE
jgi:sulfofructose kinase